MSTIHPTKTRLTMLRAVDAGQVWWCYEDGQSYWDTADWQRKVTSRMDELDRAGWVMEEQAGSRWLLTAAGRDVLAEHAPAAS